MKSLFPFLLSLFLINSLFAQDKIQRVEPPNWWAGMKHPILQLMVYGENIAALHPSIAYEGVELREIVKVQNPNYLFLNLRLSPDVKAGTFAITFSDGSATVATHNYQLLERREGSAERKGFDNTDVLYLITPDRFANGNVENDDMAGLREKANRSFKGGRHGGDIEGIRESLGFIKDMGYTAIWLNPILENDMVEYSYHGYSTTDFYRVDPRYGTNESYQQLSLEAEKMGITMIMDMIVNHCGSYHWWMKDLPMDDWINQWDEYTGTNHRKTLVQDPYAAEIDRKVFTDGWFVSTMPDLNQRNAFMGEYLIQNSIWWIEYANLAGIRMDTYPYPDMDYMTEWTERVMKEYPDFNVVGEEWYGDPAIVAYWQRGKINKNGYTSALRSLMDFPLQQAVTKALVTEEGWESGWNSLYLTLAMDFQYSEPEELVVFPDNHDMMRIFPQLNEDFELFQLAIAYYMTTRGVPQIYYGTEILMSGPDDHGLIRSDFPGGWSGDTINAFTGEGLTDDQKAAKAYMRKLLNWRQNATAVHFGTLTHFLPKDGVYVFFREDDNQRIMVVLNKNKEPYSLELDRFAEKLEGVDSGKDVVSDKLFKMDKKIDLAPMAPMILELSVQK